MSNEVEYANEFRVINSSDLLHWQAFEFVKCAIKDHDQQSVVFFAPTETNPGALVVRKNRNVYEVLDPVLMSYAVHDFCQVAGDEQ